MRLSSICLVSTARLPTMCSMPLLSSKVVKRKHLASTAPNASSSKSIDAMAEAARTGIPYQTRLSPPPADAAVAHPWPEEIIQVAVVSKDAFSDIAALPDEVWATPMRVTPDNVALFSLIDVLQAVGRSR